MTSLKQFFARYEEGANTFDPDLVTSQFAESFMGAGPSGVLCGRNDQEFREAIAQREEFFRQIGFRSARVLDVVETPVDECYTMAKVHWHMAFEKEPGNLLEFKFFITYFLYDPGSGPKVVFYISHDDEQQVMKDAGLIPS